MPLRFSSYSTFNEVILINNDVLLHRKSLMLTAKCQAMIQIISTVDVYVLNLFRLYFAHMTSQLALSHAGG